MKLRQDRRVGRHLYHQQGPEPADTDPPVGMVDTPELAATIVRAVNAVTRIRELHRPHDCATDHIKASTPVPCINEGVCRGCATTDYPCRTIRALEGQ